MELNKYIDHTLLKANAKPSDIVKLCAEAKEYGFYSVCVNSGFVPLCRKELMGSDVKIACVVGFPLGAMATEVKAFETEYACRNGASEVDMVLAVGLMKAGEYDSVKEDIKSVVDTASKSGTIVKVILECCELSNDEIIKACKLAEEAGAAFVKTSTGFGSGGALEEDVALMRRSVSSAVKVKASGGIRDRETAVKMINAGADRIGASAGIEICKKL